MPDPRIDPPWVHTPFRIPYGFTDQMGHVYYGHALLLFEMSRTEWMRAAGYTYRAFEEMGLMIPVLEAHARYRGRVFYDDLVEIGCAVRREGRSQLHFEYRVRRSGEDEILQEGWTRHVVTDMNARPKRIPPLLIDLLADMGEAPAGD